MATAVLALACVLAFVAQGVAGAGVWDADNETLLRFGANYAPAVAAGEAWRLPASVLLHGGLWHLAFNLVALADIGPAVERRLGAAATAGVFAVAGVAGALASAARHSGAISIGASGAIFGLFGVWLVLAGRAAAPADRQRRQRGLVVYAAVALGSGFLIPGVDNAAHVGGFAAGLVLGLARTPRRFWLMTALLAALALAGSRALPAAWAQPWIEEQRFAQAYRDFASADRAVSVTLQQLGREARARRVGEAAIVAQLDAEILPALRAEQARWESLRFADPGIDRERGVWAGYTRLRLEAVTALRAALAGDDAGQARIFEARMAAAAALVESVKKRQNVP